MNKEVCHPPWCLRRWRQKKMGGGVGERRRRKKNEIYVLEYQGPWGPCQEKTNKGVDCG
jgi:hypothetical protein